MTLALDLLNATDRFLGEAKITYRDRLLAQLRAQLERDMRDAFYAQGEAFVGKLQPTLPGWEGLFDEAAEETEDLFVNPIVRTIKAALTIGGDTLYRALQIVGTFDLANPLAVRYVAEHGAKLVSKVNDTTRDYLRTVIQKGVDEGWSYDRIASAITDRYEEFAVGRPQQHIDSRAHMIAVTETGNAYEAGNRVVAESLGGYGLDMEKSWLTAQDDRVCSDECQVNEAQGWIPMPEPFASGHQQPLAHPACRCAALYRRRPGAR